jgi:hypothetical protein
MLCLVVLTRTSPILLMNIGVRSRHLSTTTLVMTAKESDAVTCHSPPPWLSLRHRQDQGIPLPQSPPWNPAPVLQMVERTVKKSCKSPMTRTGQQCPPSSKARQVRMRLKLEVASLQDKYGFDLVSEGLDQVRRDMFDGLEHDVLGCWDCWVDQISREYSYCPQSVYNPFRFAHCCLL